MKVAIIGGSGFIGDRLAKRIVERGHDLLVLDLNSSSSFPAATQIVDVRQAEVLKTHLQDAEIIFHLAAEHHDNVEPISKYYDVNVDGTRNVIHAAEQHGITKIVFTSTVAVYGLSAGISTEKSAAQPFNDYGKSKLQAEELLRDWASADPSRSLVIVRPVAVFGPGNRGNIYNLLNQIYQRRFLMIGRGKNRKSLAYVENVAAFLTQQIDSDPGSHLYNYADKPDFTMAELVSLARTTFGQKDTGRRVPYALGLCGAFVFDTMNKITGRQFPISRIRIKKFCSDTIVDAQRAAGTGFRPSCTIERGMRQTLEGEFGKLPKSL